MLIKLVIITFLSLWYGSIRPDLKESFIVFTSNSVHRWKKHKKLVFTIPVLAFICFTTTAIAPASPNRGAVLAKHECFYGIPVKTILAVFTVFSIVHPQGFISIVMVTCMLWVLFRAYSHFIHLLNRWDRQNSFIADPVNSRNFNQRICSCHQRA